MTNKNILEIVSISKSYNAKHKVLDNVSLELTNGMFGLLGPNGAGKSSLMRSIASLQTIDKGKILFNRQDIAINPNVIRGRLGYLPQEFGVYPNISAVKLMDYIALLKGIVDKKQRQQQIDYLLECTHLSPFKDNAVASYSGGMKQRFGIAQALIGDPKILIVDEATAGLDPQECHSLHNLLCELAENMIVIFSTHIVEDVQNLCTNMAVLEDGKIRFHGKPKTLISTLENRLWSKQVSSSELSSLKNKYKILSTRLNSGNYHVRIVSDTSPENGFYQAEVELEDAYFHVLSQKQNIA